MKKRSAIKPLAILLFLAAATASSHNHASAQTFADAQMRYDAGDDDGAIKMYRQILTKKLDSKSRIFALLSISRVYRHKHDYAQAISMINQALLITPKTDRADLGDIYWKRASMYAAQGKSELAIKDYGEAIKTHALSDLGTINILRDRAAEFEHLHQHDKSIEDLTGALKISDQLRRTTRDPDELMKEKGREAELLYKRAIIYGQIGKTEEAKRDRESADKLTAGI